MAFVFSWRQQVLLFFSPMPWNYLSYRNHSSAWSPSLHFLLISCFIMEVKCFVTTTSCWILHALPQLTVHILLWRLDVLLVLIGCWLDQHGALFLKQLTKGCLLKNPSFHRRIPLVRMVCIMSRTIWDVLWDPEDSFTHMPSTMIMSVKRLDCIFCIQTSFSTAVMSVCFSIWFSIFPYGTFNIMEYFMLFQRA